VPFVLKERAPGVSVRKKIIEKPKRIAWWFPIMCLKMTYENMNNK